MTITEHQRHRLLSWFEQQMGPDLGATMMELLPPTDRSELATKGDLALLKADLAELRGELKTDIAELRAEVKSDIGALRGDLQRSFVTWLFASQGAVITVLGLLIATR